MWTIRIKHDYCTGHSFEDIFEKEYLLTETELRDYVEEKSINRGFSCRGCTKKNKNCNVAIKIEML